MTDAEQFRESVYQDALKAGCPADLARLIADGVNADDRKAARTNVHNGRELVGLLAACKLPPAMAAELVAAGYTTIQDCRAILDRTRGHWQALRLDLLARNLYNHLKAHP